MCFDQCVGVCTDMCMQISNKFVIYRIVNSYLKIKVMSN
jgi:hypothetical protein